MKLDPKEKAVELIDYYRTYIRKADGYNYLLPQDEVYLAKECCYKLVDELIKDNHENEELVNGGLNKTYWQEVKKEIENYA
jgi:hypothetical protein